MKIKSFTIIIYLIIFNSIALSSVNEQLVFVSNTFNSPTSNQGTLVIDIKAVSTVSNQQILGFQDAFDLDANLMANFISINFTNQYFNSSDYDPTEGYRSSDGRVSYIYTVKSGHTLTTISTSTVTIVRVTIVYSMTNATSTISWHSGFPDFAVSDDIGNDITGSEQSIPSELTNLPLPVELSSFSANVNSNNVNLNWKTATEINNNGFEVQREVRDQKSEISSWEKVGFVEGHGNSNSPKEYSFTDKNLTGVTKFAYRLKQIDNDGKYKYSKEVEVEVVPREISLFQNYPNPFNPVTEIKYNLPEAAKVILKVYNIIGQEVAILVNGIEEAGYHSVKFEGSNLPSGTYIYRMQTGSFVQTKKMVLLK